MQGRGEAFRKTKEQRGRNERNMKEKNRGEYVRSSRRLITHTDKQTSRGDRERVRTQASVAGRSLPILYMIRVFDLSRPQLATPSFPLTIHPSVQPSTRLMPRSKPSIFPRQRQLVLLAGLTCETPSLAYPQIFSTTSSLSILRRFNTLLAWLLLLAASMHASFHSVV